MIDSEIGTAMDAPVDGTDMILPCKCVDWQWNESNLAVRLQEKVMHSGECRRACPVDVPIMYRKNERYLSIV